MKCEKTKIKSVILSKIEKVKTIVIIVKNRDSIIIKKRIKILSKWLLEMEEEDVFHEPI